MSKKEPLTDESRMPWGVKFKGQKMADVPDAYLMWMWTDVNRDPWNAEVFAYIRENLDAIKANIKNGK